MRGVYLTAVTLTLLVPLVPACGDDSATTDDALDPSTFDAAPPAADAAGTDASACTPTCAAGTACAYGVCVPDVPCSTNEDCQNDSRCDPATGLCVPYGVGPGDLYDPTCTRLVVVGVFAPSKQCEWTGPPATDRWPNHANVLGTPMVADFDFDRNPAVPQPSVVLVSYDGTDGGTAACVGDPTWHGVIRVVDGGDCAQQYTIDDPPVVAAAPVALADLDGAPDGRPEIVALRVGGGLVAFKYDAAADAFAVYWQTTSTLASGICMWSGPSIHDLDDDGVPEVLLGGVVFDGTTGAVRDESIGLLYINPGQIPVVADLVGDGRPELVTGSAIYEWGPDGAWIAAATGLGTNGLVAVADFGGFGADADADDRASLDGVPEVAVVGGGSVRIMTLTGRVVFGPLTLQPTANPGAGGPPTIADFDGDGRAEVGVAGRDAYNVMDPDCTGATPDPSACPTGRADGYLWFATTQDHSSSLTGSSVFDFEGDGRAEVVYGDECFSRVYDGKTGEIAYSQHRTSCTWYENPIVADTDGDFNSEIVIPSNANCSITCPALDPMFDGLRCLEATDCPAATSCAFDAPTDPYGRCRCTEDADCGGNGYVCRDPIAGPSATGMVCRAGHPSEPMQGVRIIRDSLDRWVSSRRVWNQHAYAVTHIDEDGRVPATSAWARNWITPGLNNFRQNVIGDQDQNSSPDVTGGGVKFICDDGAVTIQLSICNRGTEPVGAGVPITIYEGDPAAAEVVCTATTANVLDAGECEPVSCRWEDIPATPTDLTAVADDAGPSSGGQNRECHEGNNQAILSGVSCNYVP